MISDAIEWALRHRVLALLIGVAAVATLMVGISSAGDSDSPSSGSTAVGTPAPAPTAVVRTGPRGIYRTTRDPAFIAVAFVRSWLSADVQRSAWLDAVTRNTTDELAAALARTDRATIPRTSVRAGSSPDVTGGVETGGATVTVDLANHEQVIVSLVYLPESGQWLVSNIEPAGAPQ